MIVSPVNVLILDFRNVISKGSQEVISRHEKYALSLKRITGFDESQITVIGTTAPGGPILESVHLQYFSTKTQKWNLLSYSFKLAIYIKQRKSHSTILVSGDPWESAVAAIVARILLKRKIPIQIQIHADIGDELWLKSNPINVVKSWLARRTLKFASSIRTTSSNQQEKILSTYGVSSGIFERIPVQLNLPDSHHINPERSQLDSLGLIGRIHKDRGLETAVRVIDIVWQKYPEVCVLIAGEGPDLEWLKAELSKISQRGNIQFLGFLESVELEEFWEKCGVLLSTAPAESFGRAMREALVRGIPVLATVSAGSLELNSQSIEGGIALINNTDTAEKVLGAYESVRKSRVSKSFIEKLIEENVVIPDNLAKSWIKMLN
jgi:glycosyltransferase involved in cell wall biosynthesis